MILFIVKVSPAPCLAAGTATVTDITQRGPGMSGRASEASEIAQRAGFYLRLAAAELDVAVKPPLSPLPPKNAWARQEGKEEAFGQRLDSIVKQPGFAQRLRRARPALSLHPPLEGRVGEQRAKHDDRRGGVTSESRVATCAQLIASAVPTASRSTLPLKGRVKIDARHRPVFISATGQAGYFCSFCSERACGTPGEKPLPRPPASQAGIPHTVRKSTAHGQWSSSSA